MLAPTCTGMRLRASVRSGVNYVCALCRRSCRCGCPHVVVLQERIDILEKAESQRPILGVDNGDSLQTVAEMVALVNAAVNGPSQPAWPPQPAYFSGGLSVKPR